MPAARVVALALLLGACGTPIDEQPPNPETDCVDYHPDADLDGFGDATAEPQRVCNGSKPEGYVVNGDDCDDTNPEIRPGVEELCDLLGIDENCNGLIDAEDPRVVDTVDTYPDADGDGYGVPGPIEQACADTPGRSRNQDDCDDADPAVHPAAGRNEDPPLVGCMEDADGDGYGALEPLNPVAVPGTDCDDDDPGRRPGATEDFGDGIDQDCNGADLWALEDDFEDSVVDAAIWDQSRGDYLYSTTYANRGQYSLQLRFGGATFTTIEIDTTGCAGGSGIDWSLAVKRDGGPDSGENLRFDMFDGTAWRRLLQVDGGGSTDAGFLAYAGVVDDPAAFGPGVRFRLSYTGASLSSETFYVDDLSIVCGGPDGDGDGVGQNIDCDDTDPDHWSDCGRCVDADGDQYGSSCDLGPDCDDGDPARNPTASDPTIDGVDEDCDGIDGPPLAVDDFETGTRDPAIWTSMTGDTQYDAVYRHDGAYSLNLGGGGATCESRPLDTSACTDGVLWSYYGKRGPEVPDLNDDLVLEWWDGARWIEADRQRGDGVTDAGFTPRTNAILDPLARSAGFRFRFTSVGSGTGTDDHFVDDLLVGCATGDEDGDGYIGILDCDDSDPRHWSDCGRCVDADGDGFGQDCDLGSDCDDTDATVSPAAADPLGDGIDSDCSGTDGPGLFDDFESGAPGSQWASMSGDFLYDRTYVHAGSFSLNLGGGGAVAESNPINTSTCSSVLWRYQGKRGPETPDAGDDLVLAWWNGGAWVEVDRQAGAGVTDAAFSERFGVITDPLARSVGFRVRLTSNGSGAGTDDHFIDDFEIACGGGDADGDGFDDLVDCDDADPDHWSDCGRCVDADGDSYGVDCDLGPDCDDAAGTVYPGAPDPAGDGIDSDCSGTDGVGLFDDFESGAPGPSWSSMTGDYAYSTSVVYDGAYSLQLGGGAAAESILLDQSTCGTQLVWSYRGKRGPDAPEVGDDLVLSYDTPTGWVEFDRLVGSSVTDPAFVERSGVIADPAALWSGFRVLLEASGTSTDDFFVDDLLVFCGLGDGDGDGVDDAIDCDPADPAHWSDCGLCQDLDGDGFGLDCDLGADCDDLRPRINPLASDPFGDGIDSDCSGVDGPGLFDDFESGPIGLAWASISGDAGYDTIHVFAGNYSLNLGGGGGVAETHPVDLSSCTSILWSYRAKRGPETPDLGDNLVLAWWDGAGWIEADRLLGAGVTDAGFAARIGEITDPRALSPDFRLRFTSNGSGTGTDDHFVDDLLLACAQGDGDGDGVDDAIDCDPADPAHWSDCGRCVDDDVDGFGIDCDLGADCDDLDATIYPGAADPFGDGIDTDCSGVDGASFFDDFELGVPGPWWATMTGSYGFDRTWFASGASSLNLGGASAVAETIAVDTSTCAAIDWAYLGKRGPDTPEVGDDLVFSYESSTGWVVFDVLAGASVTDPTFLPRAGTIVAPAAFWPGFRVRLESFGAASSDDFYVDDLEILCR